MKEIITGLRQRLAGGEAPNLIVALLMQHRGAFGNSAPLLDQVAERIQTLDGLRRQQEARMAAIKRLEDQLAVERELLTVLPGQISGLTQQIDKTFDDLVTVTEAAS
jgi:hypothetical protein